MNPYNRKQRWKLLIISMALVIVGASMWYTNQLVRKIADDERKKAKLWANAIEKKASMVHYTDLLFRRLKDDERKKVELWAAAYNKLLTETNAGDLSFYINIISSNKNIPTILTDGKKKVQSFINTSVRDSIALVKCYDKKIPDSLLAEYSIYQPIEVKYHRKTLNFIYYKDSRLFSEMQTVLNDLIKSFISEIALNAASVPVIITDSSKKNIISSGNIDSAILVNKSEMSRLISSMEKQNKPIEIKIGKNSKSYVFYEDSYLLKQLKYYPLIQFFIIGLFLFIAYLGFSNTRKAEQNQVWVGMARETAHQLGTPLSSLVAWAEYLKMKEDTQMVAFELEKDIKKLEIITERFSKIGSEPELKKENIHEVIAQTLEYFKIRSSKKVLFNLFVSDEEPYAKINLNLFNWVLENLLKNALDAMDGQGSISVAITADDKVVNIDVSDTGKGIAKSKFKTIFKPGFTTKKRGWGLGLSLSKRIVEDYHRGKIYVKQSVPEFGTTFRIVLKRENNKVL